MSMEVILQQGVPALTSGGTVIVIDAPMISAIPDTNSHARVFLFFMTSSWLDGS